MALSKEFIEAVKQIAKELELNSQFEKTFLAHLEKESEYQILIQTTKKYVGSSNLSV